MRIILSYKGKCLTVAYIVASKNTIVGWYMPNFLNTHHINEHVENKDFHITYPRDGNIHYSYKYFDPRDKCNYEKRVYFDEVIVKRFDEDKVFKDFKKEPRCDKDHDQILVMRTRQEPLSHHSFLFQYPQVGLPLDERILDKIIAPCTVSDNDICLNIDEYVGQFINYGFNIYDKNKTGFMMNIKGIIERKRFLAYETTFIEGFVFPIFPKD